MLKWNIFEVVSNSNPKRDIFEGFIDTPCIIIIFNYSISNYVWFKFHFTVIVHGQKIGTIQSICQYAYSCILFNLICILKNKYFYRILKNKYGKVKFEFKITGIHEFEINIIPYISWNILVIDLLLLNKIVYAIKIINLIKSLI